MIFWASLNRSDVDDGLRAGLIGIEQLAEITLFRVQYEEVMQAYPQLAPRRTIHEVIRRMINSQVTDLVDTSRARIMAADVRTLDDVRNQQEPIIGFGTEMAARNLEIKQFLRRRLYQHYRVRRMSAKADRIVKALFETFMQDTRVLPDAYQEKAANAEAGEGVAGRARVVADYIAGMTDRYAISEYEKLFYPSRLT